MTRNIRKQFTALLILTGILLTLSGGILIWQIFTAQKNQAIDLQTEVGKRAVNEFVILTHEIKDRLLTLTKLSDLLALSHDEQVTVLSKTRSHKDQRHTDIIDEMVLLNSQGDIVASASRVSLSPDPKNYSWPAFKQRFSSSPADNAFYSPVSIDLKGEPFMVFAVPLMNLQTGEVSGALASRIRINQVLEEIVHKPVGRRGIIYVTDHTGRIIAHPDPSLVLKGTAVKISSQTYFHHWPSGAKTIRVVENANIGNQLFAIVVERPVSEALALTIQALVILVVFLLFFLAAGVTSAIIFTKKIIQPIESLAHTAQKIRAGDLTSMAAIESDNELGLLARSFNAMTLQLTTEITKLKNAKEALSESRAGLEVKVAERTAELQKLLECSEILSSTRDLKSLYSQSVELAKTLFNLDFSTVMLLTADKKSLVIQDTIGFSKAMIGTFSLVEGQGLSTYVVEQKKPATVSNFNTESRFEVPPIVFAEKITSSLCVPMMIGNDVFGVFIGHTLPERHFQPEEIALCQSFANQVAVALDNAIHLKELHDSELKFKELFDNANDAILVYDLNGALLEVNRVTCQRLGYSRDELLSFTADKLLAPQFAENLHARIQSVSENKREVFETAHVKKSGEEIPVELSCTLFEYEGQPAILGVARDLRDRIKMEEELLKNRKLESVGVLAGGIAHDFNNILAAIIGNINLATIQVNPSGETHNLLISAEKAALRAKDLTKQLLTFAKGGEPVKEVASIAEVITDSADFILRGSNIKCCYSFPDPLWPVEIDAGQISQVIQNIIINACDVMPEGGHIEISCENIAKENSANLALEIADHVKISIKDDGPGIPPNQLSKIFDPYFTSKIKGSGLGLAITHAIITKHGGMILAESRQDHGTTFTIYLKACRHALLEKEQGPVQATPRGKGKILVMDDEEMIRTVSQGLLANLGYQVVLAADGHEAIKIYKNNATSPERIDAIIMDLTIPGGMGGKEAVKEILQINPRAKVIVSSGYSNDPIMANHQEYGFCAALDKPYQLKSLMEVLDQVLP